MFMLSVSSCRFEMLGPSLVSRSDYYLFISFLFAGNLALPAASEASEKRMTFFFLLTVIGSGLAESFVSTKLARLPFDAFRLTERFYSLL